MVILPDRQDAGSGSREPLSPVATGRLLRKEAPTKRKAVDEPRRKEIEKRLNAVTEVVEVEQPVEPLNSDDFPPEQRLEMFKENKKFDKLSYETAAKICWEFKQIKDKKEMKDKKSASLEKADDKLHMLKIEAGEDHARSTFCDAWKILRPPVVEIKKTMEWYPTKWDHIIRNLPLDIYALDDSVHSKTVELCHNL